MTQPDLFTPAILTVSELTDGIKTLLEENFIDIKVEGEISNAGASANGHIYFTLKDEDAQLSCVIWRRTAWQLGIELLDGQQIIAGGDIKVYPPHGKYQLIVRSVQQAGIGALQEAFEKLKMQLKKEGLFDEAHKKPLPKFPERIGVITSGTGAAFHDIRDTLERRWPVAKVLLHHASVQGIYAASELVKAINWFSKKQNVDLLIVGRGGGSLEDLWPFNEEAVARALFACKVPTVSAVGHEVDFSISDFVADARAATPTQAVIIATPDINKYRMYVDDLSTQLARWIVTKIEAQKVRIEQLLKSHALLMITEKVFNNHERVNNLTKSLQHRREMIFLKKKELFSSLTHRLETQDPNAPLERGYVRVHQEKEWIKRAAAFNKEEKFELEWEDEKVGISRES